MAQEKAEKKRIGLEKYVREEEEFAKLAESRRLERERKAQQPKKSKARASRSKVASPLTRQVQPPKKQSPQIWKSTLKSRPERKSVSSSASLSNPPSHYYARVLMPSQVTLADYLPELGMQCKNTKKSNLPETTFSEDIIEESSNVLIEERKDITEETIQEFDQPVIAHTTDAVPHVDSNEEAGIETKDLTKEEEDLHDWEFLLGIYKSVQS